MNVSPEALLVQAKALLDGGVGRPRQIDLRRSISNCYYAVFHTLTEESSKLLVSGASRVAFRQYIRRGYQHGHMRQVCSRFRLHPTAQTSVNSVVPLLPVHLSQISPTIREIASDFIALQTFRHTSDYDHTAFFSKDQVSNIYKRAVELSAPIRSLDKSNDANYGFLLALFTGRIIQ